MKACYVLFVLAVAAYVQQGYGVKVAKPATCDGRLTGQMTFYEDHLLSREKRQGRRRPRPSGGRQRPTQAPRTQAPPVTNAPPTTRAPPVTDAVTTAKTVTVPVTSGPTSSPCGSEVFRSANGSCNNAANPTWGQIDSAFLRILDPEYSEHSVNGQIVYGPKLFSRATGQELPNVREISRFVHDPRNDQENRPVMAMQWGQFIDHDITSTPINPTTEVCCYDDIIDDMVRQHEDVSTGGPCFPILIPAGDPHFTTTASRCMENKRSYQVSGSNGKPEQINMITPFIDGSMVYGYNDETMRSLRSDAKGRGRLEDIDNNLPRGGDETCNVVAGREQLDYCLLAGDSRVNVYPGLGAMHTVFMRMHNLIADGLAGEHPDWSDEDVFQQTRKIVGAMLQKITYTEWLRAVLGNTVMAEYGLTSGGYEYDETVNPTLYNVFSTAAFRFGHSMVTDTLNINGMTVENIDLFNDPQYVLHSLDSLLEGLLEDTAQRMDRWYSTGMTNHMFETSPRNGFDIVSLNIQRGRDHGLPSYNTWRQECGLAPLSSIDDLGRDARPYSRVYNSVDDIDLYSGALVEPRVTQGIVGDTYACLMGRQFQNLKYGDRFWYENREGPAAFTDAQIREIENQSLATVLCQTTNLVAVQRNAFMNVDDLRNPLVTCSTVSPINYSLF